MSDSFGDILWFIFLIMAFQPMVSQRMLEGMRARGKETQAVAPSR